ncbi:1-aminocyclopropane-1-carboxylate synthase-like protein 1 isoform X18 [Macaca fascicularis]|uniref:1-aminocyclopropane-1-carboxylate synthase-like protein 1 isoform X18 n=1 Tax=Macaca fascicularis TaxID=9541 RepID=UPI003D15B2F8
MISSYPLHHKTPRTPRRCSALTQEILTWHLVIEMFTLPQKDFSAPTTCLGPTCLQDLGSSHGDDLEGECSRKLDQKLPELPGVGDSAMLSPDTSYLSSRGRMIKWFWDSAEEGYRTYHMDEYDENKNPSFPHLEHGYEKAVTVCASHGFSDEQNKHSALPALCCGYRQQCRPSAPLFPVCPQLSQSDMQRVEPSLLQYADWRGHLFLREEVAKFLSFYCKSPAPLRPENVVVLNGGASLFSALATVLCEAGDWINQVYLPENHARLKAAHTYVSEELRALGIPFLSRGAGFFIWVDLRKYLPKGTFEEEMLLWRRFLDNKVLLSFGKAFECKEPGWFRFVFSDQAHRLCLGMQRVRQVLAGKSQVAEDPPSSQSQEPSDQRR